MRHQHKCIKTLIEGLDAQLDEKTKAEILEKCGRACIPRSFIAKAKACKKDAKDMDEFLNNLGQVWKHLHRDGDNLYVIYEKCYCPLVNKDSEKLQRTFCNCSRGWIKELFESVLEKAVQVELEKSIKTGDNTCKFRVRL